MITFSAREVHVKLQSYSVIVNWMATWALSWYNPNVIKAYNLTLNHCGYSDTSQM